MSGIFNSTNFECERNYNPPDPIFQSDEDGKWYHFDECWCDVYGPFDTKELARKALDQYCINFLGAQSK